MGPLRLFTLCILISTGFKSEVYKSVPIEDVASIQGIVTFKGTVPAPKKILISKDNNTCGTGNREVQWVTLTNGGGLQNVAVYITDIDHGKDWQKPKNGYLLLVPMLLLISACVWLCFREEALMPGRHFKKS